MTGSTGQENTYPNLLRLHQFIAEHYSRNELRELCYDLGIEYEELGGPDTRQGKSRELLLHVGGKKQFQQLLESLQQARPGPFDEAELEATSAAAGELHEELASFEEATRPEQQRLLENISLRQLVIFASLGILIVATAIALFLALRTPPEEKTPPMSGNFNVAVAEFGQLNAEGSVSRSREGEELAKRVFDTIEPAIEELVAAGFDIGLREPALTGLIEGEDENARALNAEQRANEMNADLLIYGNLTSNSAETALAPEFYLSDLRLANAEELSGPYEFGSPLQVSGDIEGNPVTSRDLRALLSERATALANFVIGLGFFSVNRFDEALDFFTAAEAASGWDKAEGKEVLYLFLGNTAAKRGDFESAQAYFETALAERSRYARALLGLGQMHFLQAKGDGCQPGTVDLEGMQKALDTYQEALAGSQPPLADIPAKAALASARVFLCTSASQAEDQWDDARNKYEQVIEEYDNGNERVNNLAAEAWADLGLIELLTASEGDVDAYGRAAGFYGDAIEMSSEPDRQAVLLLWRANIYLDLGQCENALTDLDAADQSYAAFQDDNPDVHLEEIETFREAVRSRRASLC